MKRRSFGFWGWVLLVSVNLAAQQNGSQWRGPLMTGEAPGAKPPITWSETEHIAWKAPIPGLGSATPVVWADRVFVLTAVPDDQVVDSAGKGEENAGRSWMRGKKADRVQHFTVLCYHLKTGELLWQTRVHSQLPHEGTHGDGTWASGSPVVEAGRVYAWFGSFGLYCLDFDGNVLWERDLGDMRIHAGFGEGTTPALFGDKIVIQWDHEGDSFLACLDKHTGKTHWQVPRDEITSWATPVVTMVDGRPQIITAATGAMAGYALETGERLWQATGLTRNVIPTPVVHEGVAVFASGFRGEAMVAIALSGARGNLDGSKHILWSRPQDTPYTPSVLCYQGRLYFYKINKGVMTCLNAQDGYLIWGPEKLEGAKTVYASPLGADGRIYSVSREGVTHVLEAGPEFKVLAVNTLDDGFDASPVAVGNRLLLRGRSYLYCLSE